MRRASVLTSFLVLAVGGCGTVPYQDATGDLDKGLTATESSLAALSTRDKLASAVLEIEPATRLKLESCQVTTKKNKLNCALTVDGKIVDPSSVVPRGLLLAKSLAQYGKGLNDLASGKDLSDISSTLDDINKSAKDAAKSAGASFPAYVAPAADLTIFLFNQFEEYKRAQLVRSILLTYGPIFDSAIKELQKETQRLQQRVVGNEAIIIRTEIDRFDQATNSTERLRLLSDILERQMQVQILASQNAIEPLTSLRTAHKKLVSLAQNPEISFDDAKKTVSDFYQKAKALYDALHPSGGVKS